MSQGYMQLGVACLVGLGAVISMAMATCETPLSHRECLPETGYQGDDVPSLLQHRVAEIAGRLKGIPQKERIHYVPPPQTLHNYLALDLQNHQYMDLSNIVQNNLGGQGPSTSAVAAEEMRFQNVFPTLTKGSVDLIVTALTKYEPKKPENNGVTGKVGCINSRGGRSTTFLFKFVDTFNHSKSVTPQKLFFSYYDIDSDRQHLSEEISTPHFEEAYLSDDTTIAVVPQTGSSPPIFRSTAVDFSGFSNPEDPSNLTPEQKKHALTFSFSRASEFEMTFATPNGSGRSSRNFFFSGIPLFPDCAMNGGESPDYCL